jgi:hypothetical protein
VKFQDSTGRKVSQFSRRESAPPDGWERRAASIARGIGRKILLAVGTPTPRKTFFAAVHGAWSGNATNLKRSTPILIDFGSGAGLF